MHELQPLAEANMWQTIATATHGKENVIGTDDSAIADTFGPFY